MRLMVGLSTATAAPVMMWAMCGAAYPLFPRMSRPSRPRRESAGPRPCVVSLCCRCRFARPPHAGPQSHRRFDLADLFGSERASQPVCSWREPRCAAYWGAAHLRPPHARSRASGVEPDHASPIVTCLSRDRHRPCPGPSAPTNVRSPPILCVACEAAVWIESRGKWRSARASAPWCDPAARRSW